MHERRAPGRQQADEQMRIGVAGEQRRLEEHHRDRPHRGAPPSRGSTILVNIGCTANSSSAETNSVVAKSAGASRIAPDVPAAVDAAGPRMVMGRELAGLPADIRFGALTPA